MKDIEDMYKTSNLTVRYIYGSSTKENVHNFIKDIFKNLDEINTKKEWKKVCQDLSKIHKTMPSVIALNYAYRNLVHIGELSISSKFESFNIGKMSRTNSGITQITVLSSPFPNGQKFSCEHDCYYCPKEPPRKENGFVEQPRSYLFDEPAVRRANANKFDACEQMWDRMSALSLCGLPIDKLEVMVLGGTWGSYPIDYRDEFIRDLYYSANTFWIDKDIRRERLTLQEEIRINMTAVVRVIGLTLETRPDHVTANEMILFDRYRCTRVQIGVQHTDKKILSKINRGCYVEDTMRAIYNLVNCGYKVDVHLMFDLPYATPEDDIKMAIRMLTDPNLRFDQAKLYPFASVDWTKTKEWEDKGMDLHYSQEELVDVLVNVMSMVHPWIRLNRVIRDIPSDYIHAGNKVTNLRQELDKELANRNLKCRCIRSREVKNKKEAIALIHQAQLFVREYDASGGKEYFISFESPDNEYIYGFCRLRLSEDMGYIRHIKPKIHRTTKEDNNETRVNMFPYLNDCAMIRELHVYGNMNPVEYNTRTTKTQHLGFGKRLVQKAEQIAIMNGYRKMAIISGVGVREYYEKKHGYHLDHTYMVKDMYLYYIWYYRWFILIEILMVILFYFIKN